MSRIEKRKEKKKELSRIETTEARKEKTRPFGSEPLSKLPSF